MNRNVRRWSVALLTLALLFSSACGTEEAAEAPKGKKLAYANSVTVVEDPDALQKLVDEMYSKDDSGITLEYKGEAFSTDGENFSCYIANAVENKYDMYFGIYADANYTDELFLSDLLRPGTAFDSVKLSRKLEPGDHEVNVAFTQVEEDLETLHAQTFVSMTFTVS